MDLSTFGQCAVLIDSDAPSPAGPVHKKLLDVLPLSCAQEIDIALALARLLHFLQSGNSAQVGSSICVENVFVDTTPVSPDSGVKSALRGPVFLRRRSSNPDGAENSSTANACSSQSNVRIDLVSAFGHFLLDMVRRSLSLCDRVASTVPRVDHDAPISSPLDTRDPTHPLYSTALLCLSSQHRPSIEDLITQLIDVRQSKAVCQLEELRAAAANEEQSQYCKSLETWIFNQLTSTEEEEKARISPSRTAHGVFSSSDDYAHHLTGDLQLQPHELRQGERVDNDVCVTSMETAPSSCLSSPRESHKTELVLPRNRCHAISAQSKRTQHKPQAGRNVLFEPPAKRQTTKTTADQNSYQLSMRSPAAVGGWGDIDIALDTATHCRVPVNLSCPEDDSPDMIFQSAAKKQQTWFLGSPLPQRVRGDCSCCMIDRHLWTAVAVEKSSSANDADPCSWVAGFYRLKAPNALWEKIPNTAHSPSILYPTSLALYGTTNLFLSSVQSGGQSDMLWMLDIDTGQWLDQPMTQNFRLRNSAVAWSENNCLLTMAGGQNRCGLSRQMWQTDIRTSKWTRGKADLPVPCEHASLLYNVAERCYLLLNTGAHDVENRVYRLDLRQQKTWCVDDRLSPAPLNNCGALLTASAGIIIAGGETESDGSSLKAHCWSNCGQWNQIPHLKIPRYRPTIVTAWENIFCLGGLVGSNLNCCHMEQLPLNCVY